jgi:hypothetical protein
MANIGWHDTSVPINTEVYRRESSDGPETITVMASIDNDGAEIRVIHQRGGKIISDTIPHWGQDPTAGRRWLDRHRDACVTDGYQLIEESSETEQ